MSTNSKMIDRGELPRRGRKQHNFGGFAGCVQIRKNRQSGTRIGVYDSIAQGIDGDYPWACVCEEHHTCCCFDTLASAISHAVAPDWCEECQKIIEQKNGGVSNES